MCKMEVERFVADDVPEAIWLRLRRLSSSQLCKRIIERHAAALSPDVVEKKADGMSSAVRSAFGFWETREGGLNSKILSRYYALFQITIAEQISSNDPRADLASVQKYSEYGHGLYTLRKQDQVFPENVLLGCLKSGHFYSYVKSLGFNINEYAADKKPRTLEEVEDKSVISLANLLCRIPELQGVVKEYLDKNPMSFQIGHAQRNNVERTERMKSHAEKTGEVLLDPPVQGNNVTYAAIYPHGSDVTKDELNGFGFEIKDIDLEKPKNDDDEPYFVGKVVHPEGSLWWDYVETYKSGYCGTSVIVPFWGMKDPFVLHLTVLYAFSIIVRYLPETWHEIEHGKLDYIRALLEHYLVVVDNVLPKLAVERLTRRRLLISQPGGLNAPI